MVKEIVIKNFKLYKDETHFSGLQPINILSGVNGRGKSTMLQSLLLPRQSVLDNIFTNNLILNGQYVELGNAVDVKNEKVSRMAPIFLSYNVDDKNSVGLTLSSDDDDAQNLSIGNVTVNGIKYNPQERPLRSLLPAIDELKSSPLRGLFDNVLYVAAERKGPALNYKAPKDKSLLDSKGEYAACMLYTHKDEVISGVMINGLYDIFPGMTDEDVPDRTFNGVVNFWLTKMFGKTTVKPDYVSSANIYTLSYRLNGNTGDNKPTNVGFGYSYVLPVLVAGLMSKHGGILILENPEAHLHPMAQSMLGKFITWIAHYGGVQMFIETHSDHMVNAFRVMVAKEMLQASEVNIIFFDDKLGAPFKQIPIEDGGHISFWPKHFCDQEELDLNEIL